jgi:preprotein translocase subunit SecA
MCGPAEARELASCAIALEQIRGLDSQLRSESDEQLAQRILALRYRAKTREPLRRLLPETYAIVREMTERRLDMRPFDVQMLGGIALSHGVVAEMETGEGKTLTAALPLVLFALSGRGAHLATANNYLAQRDAELLRPVFQALGLSMSVIATQHPNDYRRKAYACDITYGTVAEFGFDFLRDQVTSRNVALGATRTTDSQPMHRLPHFCLVDEADSVLIDEARTPLILSEATAEQDQRLIQCLRWAARNVPQLSEGYHFDYDEKDQKCYLSVEGRQLVRELPKNSTLDLWRYDELQEHMERALLVERNYHCHRHYLVREGKVHIIDENTGRIAVGRRWTRGIHQAIEAKEGLDISPNTGMAARITIQDFLRRYPHLAGMTGTASSARHELAGIYRLHVVRIPTNRPSHRSVLPTVVLLNAEDKLRAVVQEVSDVHRTGRPVLIGTRSVAQSEELSTALRLAGVPHQVLSARHDAHEADVVAQAGQRNSVTVATNMAGRGTDIKLGPGVAELGGLHVICTELHDSSRIDRQLAGRCARQGDPGSFRQFACAEDEIFSTAFGKDIAARWTPWAVGTFGMRAFRLAQQQIERKHARQRKQLLYYEEYQRRMRTRMGLDPYLDVTE